MSEETKQPTAEEQEPQQAETTEEQTAQTPETEEKSKGGKKKKEKEKTYTLTQQQMEAAELAAKQLESVKDQFVRLTAEYDNYRKRTAKEKDALYQDAKADTVRAFLAVYDNLERAVAAPGDEDSPHKKGLEMIFHQYQDILKNLGVTEIEAQGQPFDPEKHNAVMHIEDENLGESVVAQVFQAGFMLGDKVIRHALSLIHISLGQDLRRRDGHHGVLHLIGSRQRQRQPAVGGAVPPSASEAARRRTR